MRIKFHCHGKFSKICGGKENGVDEPETSFLPSGLFGIAMEVLRGESLQARPASLDVEVGIGESVFEQGF